jgi:hypothetical protein
MGIGPPATLMSMFAIPRVVLFWSRDQTRAFPENASAMFGNCAGVNVRFSKPPVLPRILPSQLPPAPMTRPAGDPPVLSKPKTARPRQGECAVGRACRRAARHTDWQTGPADRTPRPHCCSDVAGHVGRALDPHAGSQLEVWAVAQRLGAEAIHIERHCGAAGGMRDESDHRAVEVGEIVEARVRRDRIGGRCPGRRDGAGDVAPAAISAKRDRRADMGATVLAPVPDEDQGEVRSRS